MSLPDCSLDQLHPTNIKLCTYTGEDVRVLGMFDVKIQYESQVTELPVFVVGGVGPNLFGRSWMNQLRLNWQKLNNISSQQP